jgi:hypothetical protein
MLTPEIEGRRALEDRVKGKSIFGRVVVFGVVVVCVLWTGAFGQPWDGNGVEGDPYQIWDANDMQAIGVDSVYWDAHFKLCADIDLSDFNGVGGNSSFNLIGNSLINFTGVFDGNGYTISNFTYDSNGPNPMGLFAYFNDEDAEIRNLGLIEPNVSGGTGDPVGSLVAYLGDGTVAQCYAEGGKVSGGRSVGGLVGDSRGVVSYCYATCDVEGNDMVGGLVGWMTYGSVSNCYSSGSVSGDGEVGGLVGHSSKSTVSNSYSVGSVSGSSYAGGLIGKRGGGVFRSFWDIETSGQETSGGGTGKTTAEMQDANTFVGWSCDGGWTIDDRNDYPHFIWENMPGEAIIKPSYGGGSGEPNNPYRIYTAEHLNTIGLIPCDLDKQFVLMADIDLSGYTGTQFNNIYGFGGVFDGNDHTISNFTSTRTGLFGSINHIDAEVTDLSLVDANIDAESDGRVGCVAGQIFYGTITNCSTERGRVAGVQGVGGLVGDNTYGTISNCYAECNVVGTNYAVGGLVGENGGIVYDSFAIGDVNGTADEVGGLLGNNYGDVEKCYAEANVCGDSAVGGLVGRNVGALNSCYADGNTLGNSSVGGLIG